VCFAAWTLYGVLITYLIDHKALAIDKSQVGWLIGAPILTGSLFGFRSAFLRRFGGKSLHRVMVASASEWL